MGLLTVVLKFGLLGLDVVLMNGLRVEDAKGLLRDVGMAVVVDVDVLKRAEVVGTAGTGVGVRKNGRLVVIGTAGTAVGIGVLKKGGLVVVVKTRGCRGLGGSEDVRTTGSWVVVWGSL